MSELNVFSRRLKKSQESVKPKIKVLIEDSKSGFDFYKGFIKEVFPNVDFDFVEEFNSKGERLGGYNYIAKKISNIKLEKNEKLLVLFDSVLDYKLRVKVYNSIIKLSKIVDNKVYYFSPPSVEYLFLENFNLGTPVTECLCNFAESQVEDLYLGIENLVNYTDQLEMIVGDEKIVGKNLEKLFSKYCFDLYASKRIKLSKSNIPVEVLNYFIDNYKSLTLRYLVSIINKICESGTFDNENSKYLRTSGGV